MSAALQIAPSCPKCGRPVPPDAWHGLCPPCLVAVAVAPTAGRREVPDAGPELRSFGDYELVSEVGRGASSVVWRTRQLSLNRTVAVKILSAGGGATDDMRERFQREVLAVGALRHPNIVAIHEAGEHDGRFYFSMDFIEGVNLVARLKESAPSSEQAADWALTLAQALAHAHERGLVHRDVKPANILMDAADEPHLSDFGLAKLMHTDSDITLTGQAVGSACYMAPEQAAGRNDEVGPSADIYALGAVLYEMLTGRPPFLADSVPATLRLVAENEPVAPRRMNPAIPRDLETICLKCLDKTPARRYASAGELADDLGRFLRREPIHARPISRGERLWRACRRHPLVTALTTALIVSLVVGGAVLWRQWQDTNAATARLRATVQQLRSAEAEAHYAAGQPSRALALQARLLRDAPSDRAVVARLLSVLTQLDFMLPVALLDHPAEVLHAGFSPDGGTLATVCAGGQLRLWRARDFSLLHGPCQLPGELATLAFSDDGSCLLAAGRDGWIEVFSTTNLAALCERQSTNQITAANLSADGSRVFTRRADGGVEVWSAADGRSLFSLPANASRIDAVFSLDGQWVVEAASNAPVRVWPVAANLSAPPPLTVSETVRALRMAPDGRTFAVLTATRLLLCLTATNAPRSKLPLGYAPVEAVFSPDGQRLAVLHENDRLSFWHTFSGEEFLTDWHPAATLPGLGFTPDGTRFVTVEGGQEVRLLNLLNGTEDTEALVWPFDVRALTLSVDARRMVVVGGLSQLPVWDVTPCAPSTERIRSFLALRSVEFSPDGKRLLEVGVPGGVQVRETRALQTPVFRLPDAAATSARFSPHGRLLLTFGDGPAAGLGSVQIRDALTGVALGSPWLSAAPVESAAFSPDGQGVALVLAHGAVEFRPANQPTASPGATPAVHLADNQTESASSDAENEFADEPLIPPPRRRRTPPATVASTRRYYGEFSPNGRYFLSTDPDGRADLWEVRPPRLLRRLEQPPINAAAFSPDGAFVATAGSDGLVRLWSVPDGELHTAPLRLGSSVQCLAFARDGRLATGGLDRIPRLWRPGSPQPPLLLPAQEQAICSVAFSPDGNALAVMQVHGKCRVFDSRSGTVISAPLLGGGDWGLTAAFSPDGQWILTAGRAGTMRLHEHITPPDHTPAWLPELTEAVAGMKIAPEGHAEIVPASAVLALLERLRALSGDDSTSLWLRWFLADRATRSLSPHSRVTAQEAGQALLSRSQAQALRLAVLRQPHDPEPARRLAQWLETHPARIWPSRAEREVEFLRRRASLLERLAQPAQPGQ